MSHSGSTDECSLTDFPNCRSAQIIKELLNTLQHHANRITESRKSSRKLESDIISVLEQQEHIKSHIQCAIFDVQQRLKWTVNSYCKVYCRWSKQWSDGIICDITTEEKEEIEWLTVKYDDDGHSKTKEIERFSCDLKSVGMDDAEYIPDDEIMSYVVESIKSLESTDAVHPDLGDILEKKYNVVQLLDAVHHLKYDHGVDENDDKFDEIFGFFNESETENECDVNECEHVQRHYRDRRRRWQPKYGDHVDHEHELLLDIVAMIHCYFVHSFHIDRFTKNERNQIQGTADHEQEQMTMITNILTEKRKLLKHISIERRSRHFLPSVADSDEEPAVERDVDFGAMADVIGVNQEDLTEALKDYKMNRGRLISDLIDVVYGAVEKETAIWCKPKMDDITF